VTLSAWFQYESGLIIDLFVSPDCRSKGYGKMMIKAVENHARELDCLHLGWATNHANPARKLYDQVGKCDFVEYRIKF
jgi:GNAT superfamily N-acetyltransferase